MRRNEGLKAKILYVLEKVPKTRDDDVELMLYIWNMFYKGKTHYYDAKLGVTFENIRELPRHDDIKRIRALIQNEEHLFLPTSEQVRKRRRIAESQWVAWLAKEKQYATN